MLCPDQLQCGIFPFPATYTTFKVTLLLGRFVIRQCLTVIGAGLALVLFEDIIGVGRFVTGEKGMIGVAAVPTAQAGAGAVKNESVIN